jgi:predicted DCC family thiol-disulfide oxidoreductase YuxK
MKDITVIYDGQCELCKNSVFWLSKKLSITALDFHTADLLQFGITREESAREVVVISESNRYGGAGAVAFLLKARGNHFIATVISASGPVGRFGYRWVARNRNSLPVKILSGWLKR